MFKALAGSVFGALHVANERISSLDTRLRLNHLRSADEQLARTVFVVIYPRSGTTWLRMILHQLITRGEHEDEYAAAQMPYLEQVLYVQRVTSRTGGIDQVIGGTNGYRPALRVIPTHLRYGHIRRVDARAIYVWRDGCDVMMSLFHFLNFDRFSVSFDEFVRAFAAGTLGFGSWFEHVVDALGHQHDPRLLVIRYEDLQREWSTSVKRVAGFCGVECPDEECDGLRRRCSLEHMKAYEDRFNPFYVRKEAFFRRGASGEWRDKLSSAQRHILIDALDRVQRRTGVPSTLLMPGIAAEPGAHRREQ